MLHINGVGGVCGAVGVLYCFTNEIPTRSYLLYCRREAERELGRQPNGKELFISLIFLLCIGCFITLPIA